MFLNRPKLTNLKSFFQTQLFSRPFSAHLDRTDASNNHSNTNYSKSSVLIDSNSGSIFFFGPNKYVYTIGSVLYKNKKL